MKRQNRQLGVQSLIHKGREAGKEIEGKYNGNGKNNRHIWHTVRKDELKTHHHYKIAA